MSKEKEGYVMANTPYLRSKKRKNKVNRFADNQCGSALFEFSEKIKRHILHVTSEGIQSLNVYFESDNVFLTGYCESYYVKQLAQETAMRLTSFEQIENCIDVIG